MPSETSFSKLFLSGLKFAVDTSVFIEIEKYYSEDNNPDIWDILRLCSRNNIFVVSRTVIEELKKGKNYEKLSIYQLANSCKAKNEENSLLILKDLMGKYPKWIPPNVSTIADHHVVALAKANNYAVLSEEKSNSNRLKNFKHQDVSNKTKIPEICKLEGIDCYNLLQLVAKFK